METPVAPKEQKKSLWFLLTDWFSRVLMLLSLIVAVALTLAINAEFSERNIYGTGLTQIQFILCLSAIFFILYALFSLLKHIILVLLMISSLVFLVYIPYKLFTNNVKTSTKTTSVENKLFCINLNLHSDKLDSLENNINSLKISMDSLNKRIDTLNADIHDLRRH